MNEKELFNFLCNNLWIESDTDYNNITDVKLMLKDPETGRSHEISSVCLPD